VAASVVILLCYHKYRMASLETDSTQVFKTVASAAIAAGQPALGSSFRFHSPRGPVCARGYCEQCEIHGRGGRKLACQTPVGESAAAPVAQRDLLRPLGRLARLFTPWFWERRLLRPRVLRGPMLHALRYLSAAGPLVDHSAPAARRTFEEIGADVVVVGPAGEEPGAFAVDPERGDLVLGVYPDRTLGVLRGRGMLSVRFERLVLATGSYVRLPPIPGNDLPGVIGLDAAEIYGRAGALRRGLRIALWAPPGQLTRGRALAARHGLELVWLGDAAPTRIRGRGKVRGIDVERERIACDLFVTGVRQPAIDLALQAGATARLSAGELPILAIDTAPEWLDLRGAAALRSSGVPDIPAHQEAIACVCEDVRVKDLQACVAQGFADPELVKRRTGAMTGPCQGKLCAAAVLDVLRRCGVRPTPTRARPLARPVALRELASDA
jgi:hypothetical protein